MLGIPNCSFVQQGFTFGAAIGLVVFWQEQNCFIIMARIQVWAAQQRVQRVPFGLFRFPRITPVPRTNFGPREGSCRREDRP